jgi:acetyl esterase/lipase
VASWPDEYEPLREEARAMAALSRDVFAAAAADAGDADPVLHLRGWMRSLEQEDAAGRDLVVAGVPCRVFEPVEDRRGTYVQLHGGAMMYGSPRMNDHQNAVMCERLRVRVVSVGYRLAPEHPYPAAPDDAFAVLDRVLADEPGRVAIGGQSAGAYLSVLALLRLRDSGGAVARVVAANLDCGVYDQSGTPSNRGARAGDAPDLLDAGLRGNVREAFVPGRSMEDVRDPAISPLYAHLHDLPPALFTVGTADRLLDDSLFMAARWEEFGNHTELAVYPDGAHAFTAAPIELARIANDRIERFLDGALSAAK